MSVAFLHLNAKVTEVTVLAKMTPGATSVCSLFRSDTFLKKRGVAFPQEGKNYVWVKKQDKR